MWWSSVRVRGEGVCGGFSSYSLRNLGEWLRVISLLTELHLGFQPKWFKRGVARRSGLIRSTCANQNGQKESHRNLDFRHDSISV